MCGLREFTVYQLLPGVCSKTTESNICVDLEKFCLEFCCWNWLSSQLVWGGKTTKSNICVDLEKFCLEFCWWNWLSSQLVWGGKVSKSTGGRFWGWYFLSPALSSELEGKRDTHARLHSSNSHSNWKWILNSGISTAPLIGRAGYSPYSNVLISALSRKGVGVFAFCI